METITKFIGGQNRPGTKINVKGVVVHWTANEGKGADALANRNYFNSTDRFASAHLNVDDKALVECLPWRKGVAEMGYHVGATSYKATTLKELATTYPNNCTIGLEICVNSDGDFKKAYANGVKVIAMMLKEHGLGVNRLYRHFDVTGKICPAFFVEDAWAKKYLNTTAEKAYAQFKKDVQDALTPPAPAPKPTPTPTAKQMYRVRKTWADVASQIGAFGDLENAKDLANKNTGYSVFDEAGKVVYTAPASKPTPTPPAPVPTKPTPAPAPAKPKYVLPTGILKSGMTGTSVKQLQEALNAANFQCGTPDGSFGPKTLDALKRFQSVHCNPVDGVYGEKTKAALAKVLKL